MRSLPHKILIALSGCGALLIWMGCDGGTSTHRDLWEKKKSENYRYEFRWDCYCAFNQEWVEIFVQGDDIVRVENLETGAPHVEGIGEAKNSYVTIDSLFNLIDATESGAADDVAATYDAYNGFPVDVIIDYDANSIDDEIGFAIGKVTFE